MLLSYPNRRHDMQLMVDYHTTFGPQSHHGMEGRCQRYPMGQVSTSDGPWLARLLGEVRSAIAE